MKSQPPTPKASDQAAAEVVVEAAEGLEEVEVADWAPSRCRTLLQRRSPQSPTDDPST